MVSYLDTIPGLKIDRDPAFDPVNGIFDNSTAGDDVDIKVCFSEFDT